MFAIPPAHYEGWRKHFTRYPPEGIQYLLAALWVLQAKKAGVADAEIYQVAPWLDRETKEQKEKRSLQNEQAVIMDLVRTTYLDD